MQPHGPTALPRQVVIGGSTAGTGGRAAGLTSLRPWPDGSGLEVVDLLELPSPTYLIAHPGQPWLIAVSECEPGRVSSVRLDQDGALTLLSSVPTGGDGSCHLALSPDGRFVVVADYLSGSVSSVPVRSDGRLGDRVDLYQLQGSGPDPDRQQGPHAHQVVWDGDELLVADLGTDHIHRLALGPAGDLAQAGPAVSLPAGSGPRHLVVLHDHLVVAAELSGELWLARRTPGGGWTEAGRVRSTATDEGGELYPSAVRAEGDTVFVANRGPGTVAVFALDRAAGTLTLTAELDGGGRRPRDLVVTADRLWVANQTDDVVTVLSRDDAAAPPLRVHSPTPACVLLLGDVGDNLAP